MGIDQTVAIGECHIEVELSMDKIIEEGHSMIKIIEVILRKEIFNYRGQNLEVDIEVALGMIVLEEVNRSRERQYSGSFRRNDRNSSRLRSGSRASTNRDRIRCFKCREYNHFSQRLSKYIRNRKREVRADIANP